MTLLKKYARPMPKPKPASRADLKCLDSSSTSDMLTSDITSEEEEKEEFKFGSQ